MAVNNWCVLGTVHSEPKLMKIKNGVMAKTVIAIDPDINGDERIYLPVVAFNKKAHTLCALAHRGSIIFVKGRFKSHLTITSNQGKTLVGLTFKVLDFEVLAREPIDVNEDDFVGVVQLYEPETFMEGDEEDVE